MLGWFIFGKEGFWLGQQNKIRKTYQMVTSELLIQHNLLYHKFINVNLVQRTLNICSKNIVEREGAAHRNIYKQVSNITVLCT